MTDPDSSYSPAESMDLLRLGSMVAVTYTVFDEVKFLGAASDAADASDFLVESITGGTHRRAYRPVLR